MSFTSDVKKEIISRGLGGKKSGSAEKKAGLSAFIRTSGELGFIDKKPSFFIVSETENVAEFFMSVFMETFGYDLSVTHATMDRRSGRDKLLLQCPPMKAEETLTTLGLLKKTGKFKEGISEKLIDGEMEKIAYIQGAFLGGGSCILPSENGKTGYHLEIVFFERKVARDFCNLLAEFELLAKLTERKETFVVYIKSKEMISDFLSIIEAKNCLRKFSEFVQRRDEANNDNRTRNCMQGNADKAAKASVKQVLAIQGLAKKGKLEDLNEELKTLAKMRIENPAFSLQELADSLKVSKSCLNHRMRKLMTLAEQTENNAKE